MSEYICAYRDSVFGDSTIEVFHEKRDRITRCRDCKHYGGPPFYGANMAYCMIHQSMLKDSNGFCSWAEPKEES